MESAKTGRLLQGALAALFVGFICAMGALYLMWPKEDFSEKEKRTLAQLPPLSAQTLLDGTWTARFEDWMSDHAPGREGWVSLNAHVEQLSGRNGLSGVIRGKSGRLYAAPAALDEAALRRKLQKIAGLGETTGLNVTLLMIPESGYMLEGDLGWPHEAYRDADAANIAREVMGEDTVIDMADIYADEGAEALYYRTDHHYTALGAYRAFAAYMRALGRESALADEFAVETAGGFYGSMYARSGLWETAPEDIELWRHPAHAGVRVTFDDREAADTLFFTEHLSEMDKYPTYLDGNHALVDIDTGLEAGGTLLIVRDSFGHCFAPFAATAFERVVLVDPRYYHLPVSALADEIGADEILCLFGTDSLLGESGLEWLR